MTTIKISRVDGSTVEIEAETRGVWAMYPTPGKPSGWTVSHVPTGHAVKIGIRQDQAHRLLFSLAETFPAWGESLPFGGELATIVANDCDRRAIAALIQSALYPHAHNLAIARGKKR